MFSVYVYQQNSKGTDTTSRRQWGTTYPPPFFFLAKLKFIVLMGIISIYDSIYAKETLFLPILEIKVLPRKNEIHEFVSDIVNTDCDVGVCAKTVNFVKVSPALLS